MPRAGYVGDELGSGVIGSRLARDIIARRFRQERRYAPYPKWFDTAFRQLAGADALAPILWRVQRAATWLERETALAEAYRHVARAHNALGITAALPTDVAPFHTRPVRVIHGDVDANALLERVEEPGVRRLAATRLIGNVDPFSDSTDLRRDVGRRAVLRQLYT